MMKGANLDSVLKADPCPFFKTMTQGGLAWEIHDIMNALKPYEKLKGNIEGQEDAVLKLISQHVKEVIGEDELDIMGLDTLYRQRITRRNELKVEQRKRAGL